MTSRRNLPDSPATAIAEIDGAVLPPGVGSRHITTVGRATHQRLVTPGSDG